jgi:hypothetical protein
MNCLLLLSEQTGGEYIYQHSLKAEEAGCPCILAFSTHEGEVGEARGLSVLNFQHQAYIDTCVFLRLAR